MKGYEGRGRRRRTQEPTLGDKWKAMKGDKTNEGRQGSSSQNGDHAGRQMKGDKAAAAAKSSPGWRSGRERNEGRHGGSGSQQQARIKIVLGHKWRETRRQAAKSRPEWRSRRETNEGRQGGRGSQEQPGMEIMQGDKWRETRRQRQPRAAQNRDQDQEGRQGGSNNQEQPRMEMMQRDKWREKRRQRQPRAGQNANHAGSQMKDTKILSGFWRARFCPCGGHMQGSKQHFGPRLGANLAILGPVKVFGSYSMLLAAKLADFEGKLKSCSSWVGLCYVAGAICQILFGHVVGFASRNAFPAAGPRF